MIAKSSRNSSFSQIHMNEFPFSVNAQVLNIHRFVLITLLQDALEIHLRAMQTIFSSMWTDSVFAIHRLASVDRKSHLHWFMLVYNRMVMWEVLNF